jgi:beta-glucosidase
VVVLVTGKPFAIPWVKSNIPAILCQWYAGEEAGNSLADVLFGNINPSGKIPFSFPQSTGHLPCYYNHLSTDKGYYKSPGSYDKPGRDYVFASPDPLWAFGHGMSYTSFEYLSANTDKSRYHQNDTIHVKVSLKNNGTLKGKEVVQLYIRDLVSTVMTPVKMLKDFKKSELKPGEIKEITLSIPVSELYLTDQQGNKYFEAGEFELQIGTASDDIKHRVYIAVGEERNLHNLGIVQDSQNLPESKKIIRISGIVRDVQATPVPGVGITASSGNIKSTTNEAGEFIIEAGEFDLLTFSRKGFSSRTVAVDGQQNINVKLNYGH